jgi:hypothetical protein
MKNALEALTRIQLKYYDLLYDSISCEVACHFADDITEVKELLAQVEQEPYLTELDRKFLKEATTTLSKVKKRLKSKDTWDEYLHIMVGDAMCNIFGMMSDKESPPKREPLGKEIKVPCGSTDYMFGFKDGVLYAEKEHGIRVNNEK